MTKETGRGDHSRLLETVKNTLLGLSVFSWAILGFFHVSPAERLHPVPLCLAALHGTVALLFTFRSPVRKNGSLPLLLAALPSFVAGLAASRLAPPPPGWDTLSVVLFCGGSLIVCYSLFTLGRSFAILPALRRIVVRGPYRWIRHPAYAGEWIMLLACALAGSSWEGFLPPAGAVPLLMLRIAYEEKLLKSDPDYREYAERTKWRLLPWVW